MNEKKYRYTVVMASTGPSTVSGSIDLTKEEAEIVKKVTDYNNWNGRIYLPGSQIHFDIDTENPREITVAKEERSKLKNILESIGGATPIKIYINTNTDPIFDGRMCDETKSHWEETVGKYLDGEVIRLNVDNSAITIGVAI